MCRQFFLEWCLYKTHFSCEFIHYYYSLIFRNMLVSVYTLVTCRNQSCQLLKKLNLEEFCKVALRSYSSSWSCHCVPVMLMNRRLHIGAWHAQLTVETHRRRSEHTQTLSKEKKISFSFVCCHKWWWRSQSLLSRDQWCSAEQKSSHVLPQTQAPVSPVRAASRPAELHPAMSWCLHEHAFLSWC